MIKSSCQVQLPKNPVIFLSHPTCSSASLGKSMAIESRKRLLPAPTTWPSTIPQTPWDSTRVKRSTWQPGKGDPFFSVSSVSNMINMYQQKWHDQFLMIFGKPHLCCLFRSAFRTHLGLWENRYHLPSHAWTCHFTIKITISCCWHPIQSPSIGCWLTIPTSPIPSNYIAITWMHPLPFNNFSWIPGNPWFPRRSWSSKFMFGSGPCLC